MKHIFIFFIIALFVSACETNQFQSSSQLEDDKDVYSVQVNTPKVALVIGNRFYLDKLLKTTITDAVAVATVLKKIGFEVILKKNLTKDQMDDAIYLFEKRLLETKGVGFFYFAGYGVRFFGRNYLLSIDSDLIRHERHLSSYAIDADQVLKAMQAARNNVNIIVLNACGHYPLNFARSGLFRMKAPNGSIISFASDVLQTASDRNYYFGNGLFTYHLINGLERAYKTHQPIDEMFMAVSDAVMLETGGKQEPWVSDSLKRRFCFGGCELTSYF